jgi:hypothetical protein
MVLASLSQNSVLYGRCWYVNSSSQRYLLQPVLNETRGYPPVSYLCLLCGIICISRTTTAQGESNRLDITYVRDKLMSGSTYARHNLKLIMSGTNLCQVLRTSRVSVLSITYVLSLV